jgi:hypothetical protein
MAKQMTKRQRRLHAREIVRDLKALAEAAERKRKAIQPKENDNGQPQTGWQPASAVRFCATGGVGGAGDTLDAIAEAARPKEPTYTREEVARMIDQDRIGGFMIFVRAMPDTYNGQVFCTAQQARSIARELEKLGY